MTRESRASGSRARHESRVRCVRERGRPREQSSPHTCVIFSLLLAASWCLTVLDAQGAACSATHICQTPRSRPAAERTAQSPVSAAERERHKTFLRRRRGPAWIGSQRRELLLEPRPTRVVQCFSSGVKLHAQFSRRHSGETSFILLVSSRGVVSRRRGPSNSRPVLGSTY